MHTSFPRAANVIAEIKIQKECHPLYWRTEPSYTGKHHIIFEKGKLYAQEYCPTFWDSQVIKKESSLC